MKINWKYALSGLLAILGFGSCDKDRPFFGGGGLVMYGQPHANYKFLGDVKDETGKAIPGIRVVFLPDGDQPSWENDTLYADRSGRFEKDCLKYDWPDEAAKAKVKFEDVDGAENGSFRTKTLTRDELKVKQTKQTKDTWNKGDFTIEAKAVLEKED
ncbi:MAG: radical SAM-associated putative lipoprotein [Bacteroidales bacterium]|nr:radical SAM-associated putative lipoprotein [Bacteroidales bacterium]